LNLVAFSTINSKHQGFFLCGICWNLLLNAQVNYEIKILTHIQTNIHREFAKVAATLLMAKAMFSDFPRLIWAATELYFKFQTQFFVVNVLLMGTASVTCSEPNDLPCFKAAFNIMWYRQLTFRHKRKPHRMKMASRFVNACSQ
jgi:hypothetical protein